MFQFTGLALDKSNILIKRMGFPIRTSPDQRLFAPPRSLTQLVASFIAAESQGIRHTLLFTFLLNENAFNALLYFLLNQNVKELFSPYKRKIVENKGVEPLTSCVQGRRSSQLS